MSDWKAKKLVPRNCRRAAVADRAYLRRLLFLCWLFALGPASGPVLANDATDRASEQQAILHLYSQAVERYAGINDYICRFRRREVLHGKQEPEDLLEMRHRKSPSSIYLRWLDGELAGRELVFVQGKFDDRLQIRTGRSEALSRFRLSLDLRAPRATAYSRHGIDQAGIGPLLARMGQVVANLGAANGQQSPLRYLGQQMRPESEVPMLGVQQDIPPGKEKHLPRGGRRLVFFNQDPRYPEYLLPTLITTYDEAGKEVEYYCYDRMNVNVGLSLEEFDPDLLWKR
jgi:hypothetical protein